MNSKMVGKVAVLVLAGLGMAQLADSGLAVGTASDVPLRTYRVYVPEVVRDEPQRTIKPETLPYIGRIVSISLASAQLNQYSTLEQRDVTNVGGRETLEDPTHPSMVAWYPRFGRPGLRANNTVLTAHVDYVGFGPGPFAHLASSTAGDPLYLTMASGDTYAYTVKSVVLAAVASLDMEPIMFPNLDSHTERVTLISCGGTLARGAYDSRVLLIAERYIP